MKVDFNQQIKDYKGKPVVEVVRNESGEVTSEHKVTYADLVMNFLQQPEQMEDSASKTMSYKLCCKIAVAEGPVKLEPKHAAHIIEKAEKYGTPFTMGRLKDFLETK